MTQARHRFHRRPSANCNGAGAIVTIGYRPHQLRKTRYRRRRHTRLAPYRWFEDTNSVETGDWIAARNTVTLACLDQISAREAIRQRPTQLWNFERYSSNDGLHNRVVLYASSSRTLLR